MILFCLQVLYGVLQKPTKIWSSLLSTSQPPCNVRTSSRKFKFWTNAFIIKMFLTSTESQTNLSLVLFYHHNDFWALLYFLFIFKLWLWIPTLLKYIKGWYYIFDRDCDTEQYIPRFLAKQKFKSYFRDNWTRAEDLKSLQDLQESLRVVAFQLHDFHAISWQLFKHC